MNYLLNEKLRAPFQRGATQENAKVKYYKELQIYSKESSYIHFLSYWTSVTSVELSWNANLGWVGIFTWCTAALCRHRLESFYFTGVKFLLSLYAIALPWEDLPRRPSLIQSGLDKSVSALEVKLNTSGISTAQVSNIFMYLPHSLKQSVRTVGFAPTLGEERGEGRRTWSS